MSKRERREWEIRRRGKKRPRGGQLVLVEGMGGPTDDDLAQAKSPELRKKMLAMQKLAAYNFEHPMDPRPMREADARANNGLPEHKQLQIGAAVEQGLLYGLDLGRRAGLFGLDAVQWRKYRQQQRVINKLSAASRKEETRIRHSEWCADMDALYKKHPGRSKRRLAMRLEEHYRAEGDPNPPSNKTLQHIWKKPD